MRGGRPARRAAGRPGRCVRNSLPHSERAWNLRSVQQVLVLWTEYETPWRAIEGRTVMRILPSRAYTADRHRKYVQRSNRNVPAPLDSSLLFTVASTPVKARSPDAWAPQGAFHLEVLGSRELGAEDLALANLRELVLHLPEMFSSSDGNVSEEEVARTNANCYTELWTQQSEQRPGRSQVCCSPSTESTVGTAGMPLKQLAGSPHTLRHVAPCLVQAPRREPRRSEQ